MHPLQPSQRRRRKGDPTGDPPPEIPRGDRNVLVWTTGPNGPEPHSPAEIAPDPGAWPERKPGD